MNMLLSMLVLVMFSPAAFAKPVYLSGDAWVEANPGNGVVQFVWKFADSKDMWANNQVMFCADPLRENCDPNIPFAGKEVDGNQLKYDIPQEVIAGGQSAFNLANDADWLDALWLGLPDCQHVHPGKNVVFYRSVADPNIPKSGGMHILYVGPGAPFVPQANDPRLYTCGTYAVPVGQNKVATTSADSKTSSSKKTSMNDDCCNEVLSSVGKPDATDLPDEKTVQQKTRKTLSHTKKISHAVGESKSGRSLHDKVGEFKYNKSTLAGTLEEIHKDVKDLKDKSNGGTPKPCAECHTNK